MNEVISIGNKLRRSIQPSRSASGFTAGFLGSGGDLRAGFIGAAGGAAMGGLGFAFGPNPSGGALVGRAVAEGAVGGVLSTAGGGRFGDGFLGAFASSMAGPSIDSIGGGSLESTSIAERVAASAALGGTVSALNGGSFASGAASAAFQRLFNDEGELNRLSDAYKKKLEEAIAAASISKRNYYADLYKKSPEAFIKALAGGNHISKGDYDLWYTKVERRLSVIGVEKFSDLMVDSYLNGIDKALLKTLVPGGRVGSIISAAKSSHSIGTWLFGPSTPIVDMLCGSAVSGTCIWYLKEDWP